MFKSSPEIAINIIRSVAVYDTVGLLGTREFPKSRGPSTDPR